MMVKNMYGMFKTRPPPNTLPLSPVPSTYLEVTQQVSGETRHSSTPKTKHVACLSLPTPKRQCVGACSTQPSITSIDDNEPELEVTQSNPSVSRLADEYLAANPAVEPDPENAVNEVTVIERVFMTIYQRAAAAHESVLNNFLLMQTKFSFIV